MDNRRYFTQQWCTIPKAVVRLCLILINNAYAIPTYVVWMLLLSPLRKVNPDFYWWIEGYFFHWLLAMVSHWSWSAGYDVLEAGDDISECVEDRTLVIANHQSTGDVPLLMACFNSKKHILPNIMWIMDRLFKYTNFGVVSVLHQDFFIMSGKTNRDASLQALINHIIESYIPRGRKWIVLFPEGGFLRKRKAVSLKFAEKNNLPPLHAVTLPRVGALQVIMNTCGPNAIANNNSTVDVNLPKNKILNSKLKWILDITIAYPNAEPIDLGAIVFGHRPPCTTTFFYRLYSCDEVPQDQQGLTQWLYDRWYEKDKMLEMFYKTGTIPDTYCRNPVSPQVVSQDILRFVILHLFLITSTYLHLQMFQVAYNYCSYLIY